LRSKVNVVKDLAESAITGRALTIAGYDPSSGAGITADLQVFADHSVTGVSAVTALTVQSTKGVRRIEPVRGMLLRETLDCLGEDGPIAGVKIGMLATAEVVGVVAEFLRGAGISRERVVLDPVIRASSGAELLSAEGVERLVAELLAGGGVGDAESRRGGGVAGGAGGWARRDSGASVSVGGIRWFGAECGGDGGTSGAAGRFPEDGFGRGEVVSWDAGRGKVDTWDGVRFFFSVAVPVVAGGWAGGGGGWG
jgi:hypothetical protein